jgi:hypothetical protein
VDNVLVPKEVLQKLLYYVWDDEEEDYKECVSEDWSEKDLEAHAYSLIKQLQDCINDQQ